MHFGEYELSPSLIGLSLLPLISSGSFSTLIGAVLHPVLPGFNLDKGDHLVSRLPAF